METKENFFKNYLDIWINAMLDESGELLSAWHGLHDWTRMHMDKVLYPLADRLGYKIYGTNIQQEYYRVDFTMYHYFGESIWTLDYAVEHENAEFQLNDDESVKHKGWFDEFAKLLPLKCAKSRVIIGYDCFSEQFNDKLKKCLNLLNNPNILPSLTDSPILLIIFPRSNYIRKGNFSNGLVHLVQFTVNTKNNGIWEMYNECENDIFDTGMTLGLKEVYKRIAEAVI